MANDLTRRGFVAAASSLIVFTPTLLRADGHSPLEVQMLNKHPEDSKQRMVFVPNILQVQAGDTVLFKSVDRGHNSESIEGMIPEGVEEWKGAISKDIEVTFDKPGFYGYKCTPHTSVGMVGLIVVEGEGKLDNLEAAMDVKHRGKAKKVFADIWEKAEEEGLLEETTA